MLTPKSVDDEQIARIRVEGDVSDRLIAEVVVDVRPGRRVRGRVVCHLEHVPCRRTGRRRVRVVTRERDERVVRIRPDQRRYRSRSESASPPYRCGRRSPLTAVASSALDVTKTRPRLSPAQSVPLSLGARSVGHDVAGRTRGSCRFRNDVPVRSLPIATQLPQAPVNSDR